MDNNTSVTQIENVCRNLTNDNEEVIFVTVSTTNKISRCIGSQVGMDFLNQSLNQESGDTNFIQLFNSFVKEHYKIPELKLNIDQKTIERTTDYGSVTKGQPLEMHMISVDPLGFSQSDEVGTMSQVQPLDSSQTNEIEMPTPETNQMEASEEAIDGIKDDTKTLHKEKKKNKEEVSVKKSEFKMSTRRSGIQQQNEEMTKPAEKENTKTTKTGRSSSTSLSKHSKGVTSVVKKPDTRKSSGVTVSRSGRKVQMPKWRLEDQWEVKEIKTEPDEDSNYGVMNSGKKNVEKVRVFESGKGSFSRVKEGLELGECSSYSKQKMKSKGPEKNKDHSGSKNKSNMGKSSVTSYKLKVGGTIKRKNSDSFDSDVKRKCVVSTLEEAEAIIKQDKTDKDPITSSLDVSAVEDNVSLGDDITNVEQIEGKSQEENIYSALDQVVDESTGEEVKGQGQEDFKENLDAIESLFADDSNSDPDYEEEDMKEEIIDEDELEESPSSESNQIGMWACGLCVVKAKKCWLVRRHMRRMHDVHNKDLKPCRTCKKVFVYEECPHINQNVGTDYSCNTCDKVFHSKFQLQIHEESHITEKAIPCSLCNKKFKSERYVKMHIYNTHNKRNGKALTNPAEPGICDICGKWFRFKCNAVRHREIHFEEKRFGCSVCHMKFRHSSSLKRHMLSHQGKAEYVCEQCGRSFKMKQTLIQHLRIHVKQPFLKCEYCPREFRTYKGKKYHILKDHTEKASDFNFKSYVCEICGKPSSSKLTYEEHQKNHDETRAHVCSICGCRWETAAQLKAHKKSHNLAPYRYRCKVCNIPFKEPQKMKAHMTKHSHIKTCISMGLDPAKDNLSKLTNPDIVEIMEHDYETSLKSEEELQQEFESEANEIEEMPEEIKIIHIDPQQYDGTAAHVQILNEEGVEIMYDEISLPQEEITVDGEQVIYQVEIDGQNAIICDTLTSQAVESILKLHNQT